MYTRTPPEAEFAKNFCTSSKVRIGILHVVPVDVQLTIARVPVHVRDVAVRIARARVLSASIRITGALSSKAPALFPLIASSVWDQL